MGYADLGPGGDAATGAGYVPLDASGGGLPALGDPSWMVRLHNIHARTLVDNLASNPTIRQNQFADAALHVVVTDPSVDITGGSYPLSRTSPAGIIQTAATLSPPMTVYPGFRLDVSANTVDPTKPFRYWSGWFSRAHWEIQAQYVRALLPYLPSGRHEMVFDIEPYYIHGSTGGPHRYVTAAAVAYYQANTRCDLAATGTSPPAVTITGTYATPLTVDNEPILKIDIETGGSRGTATFRWSLDDGATWTASGVTTAATVALGATGLTAAFPVGTYNADNLYRGYIVGPYPTMTEQDARNAMAPFISALTSNNIRPCMYPNTITNIDSVAHDEVYNAVDGLCEVWTETTFFVERQLAGVTRTPDSDLEFAAGDRMLLYNPAVIEGMAEVDSAYKALYPRCEMRYVVDDDIFRDWGIRAEIEAVCGRLRPWVFDINRTDQAYWGTSGWLAGTYLSTLNDAAHVVPCLGTNAEHLPYQKTLFSPCVITSTGTTPPTVATYGTAGPSVIGETLVIDIQTGGTRGVATFRWSVDGGSTWAASDVVTAAAVSLGTTGLTAVFNSGTYNADNSYTGTIRSKQPFANDARARFWRVSTGGTSSIATDIYEYHRQGIQLSTEETTLSGGEYQCLYLYEGTAEPYSILTAPPYTSAGATAWTIDFTVVLPTGFGSGDCAIMAINGFNVNYASVYYQSSSGKIVLRVMNGATPTYLDLYAGPITAQTEYRIVVGRGSSGSGTARRWRHGASTTDLAFDAGLVPTSVLFGVNYDEAGPTAHTMFVPSTETADNHRRGLRFVGGIHVWHRLLDGTEASYLLANPGTSYPWGIVSG